MLKIALTEQQLEALKICSQLLEIGRFDLGGKDLVPAAQSKQILAELIQSAQPEEPVKAEVKK